MIQIYNSEMPPSVIDPRKTLAYVSGQKHTPVDLLGFIAKTWK
jgi:hypothetical protein